MTIQTDAAYLRSRIEDLLVEEFGVPRDKIDFVVPYDDMGIDSLVVLELAMLMESELQVTVTEQEIGEARSLDGVMELLRAKQKVAA